MTPKKPFFSVVIPSYERPNDLYNCLLSLNPKNQKNSPPYEIIVTDDSKSRRCEHLVKEKFPEVSYGQGKKNGPAGNRNSGVKRARGKWIVFIDDDCIADNGLLKFYNRAIQKNPKTILFEGRIYPNRKRKTWAECCPENSNGNMFWTSNLCVNKEIFHKVNGFDERFRVAYEDIDFAYRVNLLGLPSKFVIEASVCHPWRTLRTKGNNWKPKGFEINELNLFIKKHPNAKEHSSPMIYLRHLIRMLSTDFLMCIFKFRGKGIDILISQISTTIILIIKLISSKFLPR